MARPSKIRRLPKEVRELIGRLRDSGRTIDEIRFKLQELQVPGAAAISRSSFGRHIKQIDAMAERLRHSRAAAEAIIDRLGASDGKTARLNIELLHSGLMNILAGEDGKPITLKPDQAMLLGRTLRDLAVAERHDTERQLKVRKEVAGKILDQVDEASKEAAASGEPGLSADTIAQLRCDFLGVRQKAT